MLALCFDDTFPILAHIRLAEATGEESSALGMVFRIPLREDAVAREVGELLIPDVLRELGGNSMDLLEAIDVGDSYLVRRDTDNRAVFLMHGIDIEDPSAAGHSVLQDLVGKKAVPWPGHLAEW